MPVRSSGSASHGAILSLVRAGTASTRVELARVTGLSPSTVAARVDELVDGGYLRDAGPGASRGGRRPGVVEIDPGSGVVAAVDLGSHHASFGVIDMAGSLLGERHLGMDIGDGPDKVLAWVLRQMRQMVDEIGGRELLGIAVGLPGPVDSTTGLLVSPSRMPGWNGADPRGILSELSGVPVVVDNDANYMAVGELLSAAADPDHLVFLKAGSSIGCGVIVDRRLHHGHRGMAGDISHVTVADAPPIVCSCGRVGCLDVVAGGSAIVTALRGAGVEVGDTADVLRLAADAHPLTTRLLREAGARTGMVLATVINFFDPQTLVIGGHLCQADAFVAGVRSAIYTYCLPMATDQLEIAVSRTGQLGGVAGGGKAILDHLFDPLAVDATLRSRARR